MPCANVTAVSLAGRVLRAALPGLALMLALGCGPALAGTDGAVPADVTQAPMLLAQNGPRERLIQIKSRWKSDQYINIERGRVEASGIQPGWNSAMWSIERVRGQPEFVRIRNYWKPERLLNIERGELRATPIEEGWYSAMWTIEPAEAGSVRIRNRWKPDQYLNIEGGYLVSGPIQRGWWSAMWYLPRL